MQTIKKFTKRRLMADGRELMVYGELKEHNYTEGIMATKVTFNEKNGRVITADDGAVFLPVTPLKPKRTKEFSMGWAICHESDLFDEEVGIRHAKLRMEKPLYTQNGKMLCTDMVEAIMENELDYIEEHLSKFCRQE